MMPGPRIAHGLWLMRHGAALPKVNAEGLDDFHRPLTDAGKLEIREIAEGLKSIGDPPAWIVSSPFLRAVQTAEILREVLGPGIRMEHSETLRPGQRPERLTGLLAGNKSWRRALAVGHEPELSQCAATLIGASAKANFRLRKGGCCYFVFSEFPPRSPATLVWWLTPKQLRKLA
jgi:phosphohistidine phosphatase